MANETDSVFAANHQNGDGELHRFIMSILKEGETDEQETAQQQQATEVEKANDEPATQQTAVVQTATEPQSVQQPTVQPQEQPKQQAEQPKGEVEQPAQTVQGVQSVQADELDDDTKDLLAVKNHNIDDARKYVEKLGKDTQKIMASGMSESAKREAQERYESAAKTLNERIETRNAEQKAENDRLRAEAERKQAQAKKEHEEKYADINYISDWMDGHKVSEANNTMLASEGFKEGAAAASGKDIFGIAKTAKEYISENTGKLSTAAINDYVNGMLAANRLKEKYGDKFSYNIEPIDSVVLENKDIPDSVKKEFVKVRTPKEFGDNNYQSILGNAVDDFVRLFEKEYRREQGKVGKKAMEDYDNIAKNPFASEDDKDAARMVYASKVLTGVDLKPMIDRAFNSIPKDRLAALTLALSKNFGYDENKAAEYIANEFQRVCLARTGAKVNSDTEAVIIGGLMNTLVGSLAQASMRSTGGGNGLTLLDVYNASIDERAKEWAKQGMAGYGKISLRSATTMAGDSPAFGGIGKLVGGGTKWSLVRLLPRFSKGVTPKAGEAAFKLLSMTNSGRVVIGVANGAGLGAIYSPVAYSLGSLARGVTPELGEALKSSASGAVDFSMMGFTPSIMNYGADKVLKLFNGTGKAATTIRVATNIAFKDIFGPGANAALVTAKDVLLSNEKISEDLKSYYFEKFGEFLGMHVPGKLSNIRHIADEYKVRTQLNESVFTKEELRSLGYKSVKQMFDDIYAPNGKNSPGYFMKDGKAIASKLYGITVNPKVLESAKMKLLTAIGGGAIATPTITRSEIVSEYGEKGKEIYTVRTYTADGKAFSERDFGSLKDAKLEETRLGTVIKRNNVAIAEGARDAQWMDTCSERATRAVLSELNGTATEKELTDMLKTAFEKDRNGEQLTDGEKRMLKRFDEVYLQNLRSENADNSSSVRRDFNKSRGVDIDKILAKDYYKWSESEREAVDEYIKALNGENTAKDMPSEQTEPTAPSEPPAEPANEPPVVEAEKGGQQDVSAPEKEAEKPSEETPSKEGVGIEDYIKINKADDETANDIREDAENYTDEVDALRAESEQAVKYSNGESSEKPEHWDYWKEKFGLEEPKADSEPIEPAKDNSAEQPKEPKVEEKPVEAETPKEKTKADAKADIEQAAETEQEQPTVDQLNQYFSHVHLGHELTEKDLGDKARMEMFTKQFLSDKEQAVKYSNGELSEKPEGYAYMKQMFGLKDPVKQPTTNKGKTEKDANKTAQLDIINKSNPMRDEQHTGIRSVDDIKTFKEAVSDSEAPFTPDYTKEDAESALKAGEITVYSSKPIEDGVFVTPSKMEAKNYAGGGKVFSKRVSIEDVAWIDAIEGQYARLRASDIETGVKERLEREGVTYKKGDELVAEHEGSPLTIVVDAVGKNGNVTKSHVKSSGEPYHSNGEVVFTPKEKPQEPTVKDWVDDVASEARKRGYRIVNGQRVERQGALSEGTDVVYGDEHTTKFSQNDKPTTRFAIVSAKKMQPSHIRGQRNPAFFNDEGQPKNRTDQVSVAREEEIAKNIDPEEITVGVTAYQGAPTINSRGEVIQGNNRAAALREMYSGGYGMSVKKYRQFLKDNAKMFGLTPEDIDRIEDPVLVNVADVADAEAIRLGQLKATDNESGGVQFIEPKPTVQKLVGANKLTRFMDTLLETENPMDSVKDLIRKNGVKALKFMRDMGIINETQYNSAFNAKDTLSSQARSDLEGVIRHAMFDGGPTGIEEMFDLMPDAAQKGILETIARDFSSDEQSRIKPIIQESILAYHNAVSTSKEFANAKTAEQAARAMRNYARQVQLIGEEQVLPEKYFSKFALLLAERYRAYSKLSIKAMFNELYDKLQGVSESSGDLFAGEVAAEKLNINEAFKKVFNYGDTELPRGDVLGDTARTGTKGEPGSEGGTGGRGQDKAGERGADSQRGTGGAAEEGTNSLIDTANKAANKARLQKAEDYSAFAEQYGLDAEDVAMYAEGMKKGSTSQAMRARAMIGRKIIAAHEGEIHSLRDVRKFRRPIEEALKEKFGDVDKLLEEYRNQVEDEHKAMEAARKKAQEEEAKRKAHLEELSLLSDDEIDRRYMEALDNGNEVAARDMLDEAARRKGYADTDSEYQGVGAWVAPSNPGYESDEARRADVEDNAPNVNLEDIALGYNLQPDDYFTHPERYSQNTPHGLESSRSIQAALESLKRGEKGVKVKVYRAVPISVMEGKLRNGDWVTPSKKYAEMHGNSRLKGKYRIIEDEVPANELWWDGNDANEWGYDNGKEYKYKNAKNNRKLNDLVVRDDNGNVIVPSKRFNQRKADERYQIGMEGVKPSKAEVALRDAVIDRLRENGMEVITDVAEGQRVLDEANGKARLNSVVSSLAKAESTIKDWLANNKRGKTFRIELPLRTQRMVRDAMGRDFESHNITANGIAHAQKNHGINGVKLGEKSLPLSKEDMELLPYIMVAPDYVRRGNSDATGRTSVRFYKELSNGYVVVAEKEYKNSPNDMETITMWAEKSDKATNAQRNAAPDTHVRNAILDIDAAKIRKDAEDAIVMDVKVRENRVWHGSGADFEAFDITDHIRFFRTANGEAYGFTVGGKIYIDPKIATSETPVHEYAHLWASALRSGNPKEWQNVVGLMKGTSVWEEVKKRYSELNTDDDIADEVIATYSGRRGAERLREEAHKVADGNGDLFEKAEAISALGRVKESLKKFWKGVCDFLHIHYKSAEEVADRVMKDLLDGVDTRKMGKGEAGVRFSAKQKRALETAEQSQKTAIATAVSSADGAKVLNNLDTLARNLEKTSSHRKTFIGDIAKAFGVDNRGKSSKYATFETKSGEVVTIRISDHNAKVSNFDTVGEDNGISIVVTRKPNKGITNDGSAHIVEFFYPEISLQRAEGKPLVEIVESIKQALYSGEFKDTTGLAERQEVNGEDVVRYQLSVTGKNTKGGDTGYDSKHTEIEQAVNKKLKRNSTSDEIKAEIDRVKKLRAEATKEYLSGKPHSEVAKGDAAALRERLNELNAKKTVAVENERSAKLTEKLADLNSKLIEATESGDAEKVKSLTTEIKRLKTDIGNTGIRSRYKAKISEIKSKSENVSDLAKSLVKYISGELSPILAKEMGKAEFNALVGSVRDIAKQWNAKDGTEQDRNNLATKLDDTIRKVDDVIVGIETRKLINDLADMFSIKTTKKDSSGKKIGVKVSNTVRIAIETLKGMFRGFDGEFGNELKSLVKSLDGMLIRKKELQGRLKELELSEASANERLNSGTITKDEYDAEVEAINRERNDVKSEMANFDTVFSDALSETNDAIDAAVPRTTEEYNKLWNDLMAKQQDEQDGVAQMSAHDKEMLKIMPFVRSLVDVRELFAEADKSQSRLKALEEQWKSDAPTPTDTEMEAANRRDRRLQTALKIREERTKLYAAKDAARNALRDLNNDVRSLLKIGKTQYMAQQQERLEHRSEVAHIGIAAVDTGKERPAGVKGQQEAKESEDKSVGVLRRLWNWVFLAPTESAESMLSRVDVNHFSGDGELYHLIMESERGYSRSEDRRIESVEGLRSEIQFKCKELFGSKKPKDGNKRIKFTQTLSGEPVPAEVTKGEALSLYLWSLSEEGRAKLESQGIDAFSISEIKAGLGDNWVKFGEWVVGDFLPKLYDKYNEKYVEKYGTEITRHENYFPFKIYGGDIVTKDELESFDNGNTIPTPSALKERVKHNYQLSTTEDALKILNEHVAEMEDWYHFADMREDISILLSSRAFRETLKLQGPNKWRKFRDAMHTLAGVDKRDESVTSQVINEAQSMYASSAVGFRYWTALKQLQSMIAGVNYSYNPRFQARFFANILMPVGMELLAGNVKNAENTFAGMVGSCYWAWKNLPQFRERYRNGKMGNIMLEYESVVGNSNSLYRWIKKNVSQKGLFLNQVFDAAAVAVYAKSIYDYEYTRSIRKGATEEDAHKYAMTCAETNYNKTQQSSGRAYVSKMQVSGNPIEKGLTTFQTASLGFMRKSINDINDIQRAYRLLRLGKEKPLHSISKGAKATVDLLWDGVVMPASWNLINVIGVAGFYYGAKAIFNALFGGDDDNAPIKDATGKTALDRFIEGHTGDVAFATISAPLQGTILNNLVNSAWSGYGGWTPTMAEGAISEVLRSAGETLKGYKDSDSLSGYIEDLDEDAAKYTIKTVLYALFRGYTGIDMKTVERFYNAFYDYKVNGSSLNLISAANFLSTPMSSMRDHEAKDYYLGAYGKTSETAKDLEDYIVKRAYADGKIFKREVESGGARGKVAELFRSRAFKRDLNKYVDEWAEYHIRDASDAMGYHDEWLKNHERKEIIRKNRELEYSDEQAKQKTDSLKLALGYEQKSGNSERTLRYNLVHDILRQIKKKLTGGDNERKEAFALMKELERIDKVKGHTHSDYVKLAEKAGVKDFQMIPKGVSESGKYVNKSDIDNGTVARGEVKGSYGIIATADDVKADARFRKLHDGSEKQKAKAKEVMKMYSDGDISYQDAYRRMTDIGDGLVTAVYASEADRLIKDLKTKLTKAVKAGDDKAADAIMEQIRSIRGKVIDGDMKPKEEVAKMLLNSIE